MPRFFINHPDIIPRAQSQQILVAWYVILRCILLIIIFHSRSLVFNCIAVQCSCSICGHSCSLVFSGIPFLFTSVPFVFIRVPFVFTCVPFVFIRVHLCSLVFTSVHSCSDSCGVLDQIPTPAFSFDTMCIVYRLSYERRGDVSFIARETISYFVTSERSERGTKYDHDIVSRAIKLTSPRLSYDNLFITYLFPYSEQKSDYIFKLFILWVHFRMNAKLLLKIR